MKEAVKNRAYGTGLLRCIVVLLELTQNLRLPDNHGVQTRSHAEQMPDRLRPMMGIDVVIQTIGAFLSLLISQERLDLLRCRLTIPRCRDDLDAVTSR